MLHIDACKFFKLKHIKIELVNIKTFKYSANLDVKVLVPFLWIESIRTYTASSSKKIMPKIVFHKKL